MNLEESQEGLSNVNNALKSPFIGLDNKCSEIKCLLCDNKFILPTNEEDFLSHLFREHRLVIGDVSQIASLKSYVHYWAVKFKEAPLTNYCTTLLMDCTPDGKPSKNECYFLLSDCISEDKTLRYEIHQAKLEWVLCEQSKEREDASFKRGCIFCRMEFSSSRVAYIKHLSEKHNLYLGKPENLVFLDEFLDKIQSTVERLICIYCEKVFKDRTALKEHMRKKLHKRVNPNNREYDKFYVNNYLEPGKSWRQKRSNSTERETLDDENSDNDDDETWADWNDDGNGISCLFCGHNTKEFSSILVHMKTEHNFDLQNAVKGLTFYFKIKVVNYIRRQIHLNQCIFCETKYDNIIDHMKDKNHFKLPSQKIWDQPQYYFPMCENDPFLYNLDTDGSSDEESDVENVSGAVRDVNLQDTGNTILPLKIT